MKNESKLLTIALLLGGVVITIFGILSVRNLFLGTSLSVYDILLDTTVLLACGIAYRILFLLRKVLVLLYKEQAFTDGMIVQVVQIKRLFLVMFFVLVVNIPYYFKLADDADAPGVFPIGVAITILPFFCYIFSKIVEELFRRATNLKKENDLMI
ncbi:MAG: DUF2975 domain-containing protein [Enterococcus sp.]